MSLPRNVLLLTLAFAAAPVAFAKPAADDGVSKVFGGIHAEAGRTHGDLDTVNGGIDIDANATTGDATTVNGGIDVGAQARTGDLQTVNGGIEVGERSRTGDVETVNGGITLGRGVAVDGGVTTVNGQIFADRGCSVRGNVHTVNGAIGLVDTDVGGGLQTVSGDITVGVGSHVKGGLRVEKNESKIIIKPKRDPRVVIGPNAVVEGALVFERPVTLYVHATAKTGPITGATAKRFDTATAPDHD